MRAARFLVCTPLRVQRGAQWDPTAAAAVAAVCRAVPPFPLKPCHPPPPPKKPRRGQLKALVDIHGADEGLGGNLTEDEIKVICGALDLTSKTARK